MYFVLSEGTGEGGPGVFRGVNITLSKSYWEMFHFPPTPVKAALGTRVGVDSKGVPQ